MTATRCCGSMVLVRLPVTPAAPSVTNGTNCLSAAHHRDQPRSPGPAPLRATVANPCLPTLPARVSHWAVSLAHPRAAHDKVTGRWTEPSWQRRPREGPDDHTPRASIQAATQRSCLLLATRPSRFKNEGEPVDGTAHGGGSRPR
jgi:hypothetical protein